MSNSSISPIDRSLLGAITLGQSRLGSEGNKGVLHIPQSSIITEDLPPGCLLSYLRHSWEESYPSAEMQLVYSVAPADWAT